MIDIVKDFTFNAFLLVTFILIYSKSIRGKLNLQIPNKITIFSLTSVLIIICMTFPIPFFEGHVFDLRQVPFILGALYGGRKVAFLLLIILLSYRFYLGGEGFYGALATNMLLFTTLWYTIPIFNKINNLNKKINISLLMGSLGIIWMVIVIFIFFSYRITETFWSLILIFIVIQCLAVAICVYFFEKSKLENAVTIKIKRLEKLNTVSELAASISHEVRNPLTTTRGFIQLLRDPNLTEEKKNMYIEHSLNELDRATSIISDYLTFSKPDLKQAKILELNKEFSHILAIIEPYASYNNVELKLEKAQEDILIFGDSSKIQQCFINLLKNGIEAMPEGGVLTIELKKNNNNAIIVVSDTGIGMNEEEINNLGTPYYSTKIKGTGLGTMVVFSIIQAMEGKIRVESEKEVGTRFTITIPIIENE
ncbi:ATP-binding protein [Bacillus sp. FJAT-45037]|uniref:ATP-binding protein n=1 Tax=Bacillus sp. FJAT-45037 TaxID=2011007 RepID=UPI000C243203|nr:ATP-binding protein [Bacillus sp. FJAT-45037]